MKMYIDWLFRQENDFQVHQNQILPPHPHSAGDDNIPDTIQSAATIFQPHYNYRMPKHNVLRHSQPLLHHHDHPQHQNNQSLLQL